MPNWNEIQRQVSAMESPFDHVRREYLRKLVQKTGRNVIAYYSGWLQKGNNRLAAIQDNDKDGFMNAIYKMDKGLGLDLILHTPGGDVAATESLGNYLRSVFGTNIRCFVPQQAMSGGTLLACMGECIVMGKESSLGPIDPQYNGIPAHGVIEEFNEAKNALKTDPKSWPVWQTIISQYHPTFIGECAKAIQWSSEIASNWLISGMFRNCRDKKKKTNAVLKVLNNHASTKNHSRHIAMDEARRIGLVIKQLEDDDSLQDIVLSLHHAYMCTFWNTKAIKIIENSTGGALTINLPG